MLPSDISVDLNLLCASNLHNLTMSASSGLLLQMLWLFHHTNSDGGALTLSHVSQNVAIPVKDYN